MAKQRDYANYDACKICGKVYKNGPTGVWKHLEYEHGITSKKDKYLHMEQVPNHDYKGPQ